MLEQLTPRHALVIGVRAGDRAVAGHEPEPRDDRRRAAARVLDGGRGGVQLPARLPHARRGHRVPGAEGRPGDDRRVRAGSPRSSGSSAAFVGAAISIKWMVGYLERHDLSIFGWYRHRHRGGGRRSRWSRTPSDLARPGDHGKRPVRCGTWSTGRVRRGSSALARRHRRGRRAVGARLSARRARRAAAATRSAALPANATWLETLNAWRAASRSGAGDRGRRRGRPAALAHSTYMVETRGLRPRRGQRRDLGDRRRAPLAGANGNVAASSDATKTDRRFVEQWITAPFHAAGMLDPKLATSGFGAYRQGRRHAVAGRGDARRDPRSHRARPRRARHVPRRQTRCCRSRSSPTAAASRPDPLSPCPGYNPGGGDRSTPACRCSRCSRRRRPRQRSPRTVDDVTRRPRRALRLRRDDATRTRTAPSQTLGREVLASRHQVVVVPRQPLAQGVRLRRRASPSTYAGRDGADGHELVVHRRPRCPRSRSGTRSIVEGHAQDALRPAHGLAARSRRRRRSPSSTRRCRDRDRAVGLLDQGRHADDPGGRAPRRDHRSRSRATRLLEPNETFTRPCCRTRRTRAILRATRRASQIRSDDKAGTPRTRRGSRSATPRSSRVTPTARPLRFNGVAVDDEDRTGHGGLTTSTARAPAAASADYAAKSGTVTIPAGQTSAVDLDHGDGPTRPPRPPSASRVKLSNPIGASRSSSAPRSARSTTTTSTSAAAPCGAAEHAPRSQPGCSGPSPRGRVVGGHGVWHRVGPGSTGAGGTEAMRARVGVGSAAALVVGVLVPVGERPGRGPHRAGGHQPGQRVDLRRGGQLPEPDVHRTAFESDPPGLVAGDTNGWTDVFVRDRVTSTIKRVSLTSTGAEADIGGESPTISGDGRYVAFAAYDRMTTDDTNDFKDVFIRDHGEHGDLGQQAGGRRLREQPQLEPGDQRRRQARRVPRPPRRTWTPRRTTTTPTTCSSAR